MKPFWRDTINNMTIRKKLISIYIIVGLIPVVTVGFYLITNMRAMLIEQATEEARTNTYRIEERLKEAFKICTDVSDNLYLDEKLKKIATTHYKDQLELILDYEEYTAMDAYLRLYNNEIGSIRFYVDNDTILNNSQIMKVTEYTKNQDWYKDAIAGNGKIKFIYKYDEFSRKNHLCLVRFVKTDSTDDNLKLGVLVINMNEYYSAKLFKDEPYETIISVVGDGVVMSNNPSLIGSKQNETEMIARFKFKSEDIAEGKYNGKKSMIIIENFSPSATATQFKIMSIVPIENIVKEANLKSLLSLLIILFSLFVSIGLIMVFSKIFSDRINIFRKEMHKVVTGDFNIEEKIEGQDEIAELYEDLNTMIKSIQQLIREVYEDKLFREQMNNRQREVEFKMLASQINPHFLYNTLETIRMKAFINDQFEIADIVKKVAKIMRRNLEISSSLVPIESEIELVKNYLEIQKFRFGEKVSFEIQVLCEVNNYLIVPLLLQPLVENAFVHGLENKVGDGKIVIRIDEQEDYLTIKVSDDGVGMDEVTLMKLQHKINHFDVNRKDSIGLTNVNQRLKLFYGEKYYLEIISKRDKGTEVIIYLPPMEGGIEDVKSANS